MSLFLLSGVANADKWLCGTQKLKTSYFICGTFPDAHPDDWFNQYFYIVDDALNSGNGLRRVQFRELGGNVEFNDGNCTQGTIELFCSGDTHVFSFDKSNYSFHYMRDREARKNFRVSGRCTPFVNHETNSNMDFDDWMPFAEESEVAEQDWSVEEYLSDEEYIAYLQKFLVEVGFKPKDFLSQ